MCIADHGTVHIVCGSDKIQARNAASVQTICQLDESTYYVIEGESQSMQVEPETRHADSCLQRCWYHTLQLRTNHRQQRSLHDVTDQILHGTRSTSTRFGGNASMMATDMQQDKPCESMHNKRSAGMRDCQQQTRTPSDHSSTHRCFLETTCYPVLDLLAAQPPSADAHSLQ